MKSNKTLDFKVKANIMEKKLVLLDSSTGQEIHKLDFGSCYYGCNLTNLAILYNYSPEKAEYVILLEENGPGVEIVIFENFDKFLFFFHEILLKIFEKGSRTK